VQDYYLICENCNGYYKLEEGENPDSFEDQCSICGGDLILVNDIDYYLDEQYTKTYYDTPNHQKTLGKKSFVILGLCVLISLTLIPNSPLSNLLSLHDSLTHDNSFLGSDNRGYVTKNVYSNYGSYGPKIAVITGMHPREISAKTVVPNVIRSYALTHNVEIVNYQINVTDNPQDYTTGRKNGEGLVAQYVVPDIEKSDYNLVIIVHNHKQSYGNGYYIATPTMDAKSVSMAANIHNILQDFNYYQRSADETPHSTSITKVDNPIAAAGTPVFVYEIPEWVGNSDVYSSSNRLIDACFNFLNH
jgi:hypothetical protein